MIMALSILAGLGVGCLSYRVLFYDLADFMDGFVTLSTVFFFQRRWPFARRNKGPTAEDFEDGDWSSGIRFLCFLVLTFGSGYFAYSELQKHFG